MYKTIKGQGALEYLIIIGAAILVAVIVVSLIISVSRSNSDTATRQNEQFNDMIDNTIIPPMVLNVDCNRAGNKVEVVINPSNSPGVTDYCLVFNNVPNLSSCNLANVNPLVFNSVTIPNMEKQNISIIAKKGTVAYSQPSMPPVTCTPHN